MFAPQNLVRDPPFSKLDLIICRNLLIYFEPAQQSRILELFHFALNPGGYLLLGTAESADVAPGLFAPVNARLRIYQAIRPARVAGRGVVCRGAGGRWRP